MQLPHPIYCLYRWLFGFCCWCSYYFQTPKSTLSLLIDYFTDLVKMRALETAADNYYKQKAIRGFCHLYDGQEAIVVGVESVLTFDDHVITAYRDHAHMIGRGATIKETMAELMGRADGCSEGKGGSMHMYKTENNFYGGNGIVGAQVPLGAGIAFAQSYLNSGRVCVTYYGDGAANQGQISEAYNMAALQGVPAIFICENNRYAMGTSNKRAAYSTKYYTRGDYVPGLWVDGSDVLSVREAMKFATNFVKEQKLPILLEMDTYRYHGHSMSDPGTSYRSRDEITEIRKSRDPISLLKVKLVDAGWAEADELKKLEKSLRKEVEAECKEALASPLPSDSELYTDVYPGDDKAYIRGVETVLSHNKK